jgi:hypothetical protein
MPKGSSRRLTSAAEALRLRGKESDVVLYALEKERADNEAAAA